MAARPLVPHARLALEVMADLDEPRIPVRQYELAMSQRGCNAPDCNRALISLVGRGWAVTDGSTVRLTETGWLAALKGQPQPSRKKKAVASHRRLPAGLF